MSVGTPAEAKGIAAAPDSGPESGPQLNIRLLQEGDQWLVEYQHSDGRRWQSAVPLQAEFAALLYPSPQEAVSGAFVESLQADWQRITLQMGQHLFPPDVAEIRTLFSGSTPSNSRRNGRLNVRLDVVSPELQWLPWELARLDDDAPPLSLMPAAAVFYRSLRRALPLPADGSEPPRRAPGADGGCPVGVRHPRH